MMKNVYNSPKMDLIGVSHEDVLCTSNYKFGVDKENIGDGNTDIVDVRDLLKGRS